MGSKECWEVSYRNELDQAITARSGGNEGMARVCARRAAGIVVGEYLERLGYTNLTRSVMDRLIKFDNLPATDMQCKEIASHFLLQVDQAHKLPKNIDLIADVQVLEKKLLKDPIH